MIVVSRHITPKGYLGITLFPFIFLREKQFLDNKALVNHEKIHLQQQIELLIIPFLIIYAIEFSIKLIKFRDWQKAYRTISFEREAYKNETDSEYLKTRKFWNFIHYLS